MNKQRKIYRQQRKNNSTIDIYFVSNSRPAFIIGFNPGDLWSRGRAVMALHSLKANRYKFAVLTDYKNRVKNTPSQCHRNMLAEGYVLTMVLYDTEADKDFIKANFIDLTLKFENKKMQSEYLIFRFYDFATYQKEESYFLPLLSSLKEDVTGRGKFPDSTIKIWRL